MNEFIRKRKSTRRFVMKDLDEDIIGKINEKINNLKPLYPEIKYTVEVEQKTKGILGIKAPYYLIFRSEEKEGSSTNIGFLGQQMDLFLSELQLGSCWVGLAKADEQGTSCKLPFVICMAFGEAVGSPYRSQSEFKRKSLQQISEGSDPRLEAARLAPSGTNSQNWYFIADNGAIHCYKKKVYAVLGFLYNRLADIDIGIAIYHIATETPCFEFKQLNNAPTRPNCVYIGTVC